MFQNRLEPFKDLSKELSLLHREMDDMFRRTFGLSRDASFEGFGSGVPNVNTFVKDQRFYVEVEVPGVKKDQLDVSVVGNMLTICGERKSSRDVREHEYLLREAHFGSFRRRLMLPDSVDAEMIQASCRNGILEISMPMKKQCFCGHKIAIEGGDEEDLGEPL